MNGTMAVVIRSSPSNDASFQVVLDRSVGTGGIHMVTRHEAHGQSRALTSQAKQVFARLLDKSDTFGVRKITFGDDFLAPFITPSQRSHLSRYITVLVNTLAAAYEARPALCVVREGLSELVVNAVLHSFPDAKVVIDDAELESPYIDPRL